MCWLVNRKWKIYTAKEIKTGANISGYSTLLVGEGAFKIPGPFGLPPNLSAGNIIPKIILQLLFESFDYNLYFILHPSF